VPDNRRRVSTMSGVRSMQRLESLTAQAIYGERKSMYEHRKHKDAMKMQQYLDSASAAARQARSLQEGRSRPSQDSDDSPTRGLSQGDAFSSEAEIAAAERRAESAERRAKQATEATGEALKRAEQAENAAAVLRIRLRLAEIECERAKVLHAIDGARAQSTARDGWRRWLQQRHGRGRGAAEPSVATSDLDAPPTLPAKGKYSSADL
jgi:hypothetical protein